MKNNIVASNNQTTLISMNAASQLLLKFNSKNYASMNAASHLPLKFNAILLFLLSSSWIRWLFLVIMSIVFRSARTFAHIGYAKTIATTCNFSIPHWIDGTSCRCFQNFKRCMVKVGKTFTSIDLAIILFNSDEDLPHSIMEQNIKLSLMNSVFLMLRSMKKILLSNP